MAAPRFNKQKDSFLRTLQELEKNGNELLRKLYSEEKIKGLKNDINNFVEGVDVLANEFNAIKEKFAELASSISSGLDGGKNRNANFWKGEFDKDHDKGIFEWMHEQILDLLKQRWNKLKLGNGNGPNTPPNYTRANFNNYKEIISTQNESKSKINENKKQQIERMRAAGIALSKISNKVSKAASQAGPSQPQGNN